MTVILTPRLMLIPASIDQVRAMIDGDSAQASALLGAVVPPGWPAEAEAREGLPWHLQAMENDPAQTRDASVAKP